MRRKLLITYWIPPEVAAFLKDDFDFVHPEEEIVGFYSAEEIKRLIPDFEVVLLGDQRFDRETIDRAGNLKVICRSGAGCDSVDYAYAGGKGIAVVNAPNSVTQPTAELTIGIMLDAARRISHMDRVIRREKRRVECPAFIGATTGLFDKTLGIVGFGRIGKAVAAKAKGMGMRVIYADAFRAPKELEDSLEARMVSREELLRNADFVSLHCPYTPENRHLINAESLAMMKPSAFLVNASRGKMVDEAALVAALKNRTIKGAALDVYEFEPEINAELLTMDNVVLVPHIGTWVFESRVAMCKEAIDGALAVFRGETPPNLFNSQYLISK